MGAEAIYEGYDESGLERQYNLRPRHPEREAVYAEYEARSAALRAAVDGRYDVPYGPADRQVLDILPAAAPGRVLLFFHGGYWRALDKSIFTCIAEPYLQAGWTVVLPNYTLAPAASVSAIVEEARQAVAWTARNLLPAGGPLVVSGHSAGGHLTAMAMLTDWRARGFESSPISGGISVSGIFDLEPIRHTSINTLVGLTEAETPPNSPIGLVRPEAGPLLLIVGEAETDEFHGQTVRFADAWAAAGNHAEVIRAVDDTHFSVLGTLSDPVSDLYRATSRFLRECAQG